MGELLTQVAQQPAKFLTGQKSGVFRLCGALQRIKRLSAGLKLHILKRLGELSRMVVVKMWSDFSVPHWTAGHFSLTYWLSVGGNECAQCIWDLAVFLKNRVRLTYAQPQPKRF
jgi:hypothetical protein